MISFFALDSYIGKSYSKHGPDSVRRLSSRIRGEEVANYLGAKYNPTEGYENDVCIHVKPKILDEVPDGHWLDLLDGTYLIHSLRQRPKIKVITASQCSYEYQKSHYPNEVVLIPSHHINIDRLKRTRKEIKVAGYIGVPSPAIYQRFDDIATRLKEIGIDFVTEYLFKTKQDALDFYNKIDIFVFGDWDSFDHPHRIPTKIINAASFGIPSVAFPIQANKEFEGYYMQARNMDETVEGVNRLKNEYFYNEMVSKIIPMSEKYHISNVAELYKKLT
jgi:hypothetical protein